VKVKVADNVAGAGRWSHAHIVNRGARMPAAGGAVHVQVWNISGEVVTQARTLFTQRRRRSSRCTAAHGTWLAGHFTDRPWTDSVNRWSTQSTSTVRSFGLTCVSVDVSVVLQVEQSVGRVYLCVCLDDNFRMK